MIPTYIIVHHSGTPRDKTTFESINEYHRQLWNFKSSLGYYIGYHYLIVGSGKLYQGRAENEEGAHARGWNDKSIGVCLTGDFMTEKPSNEQLKTLKELLDNLCKKWNIKKENIKGHREVWQTLCPGDNLMVWIETYRRISSENIDRKAIIEQIKGLLDKLA
jgi:N-acetyl-anhydromuramyl-L-alanine amidase AmpD